VKELAAAAEGKEPVIDGEPVAAAAPTDSVPPKKGSACPGCEVA